MTDETRPTDGVEEPYHGRHIAHWDSTSSLYEAVTTAVSAVSGEARSAVASKYDETHASALSRLFGEGSDASASSTGVVKFVLSECVVSVHSDGQIAVDPAAGSEPSTTA